MQIPTIHFPHLLPALLFGLLFVCFAIRAYVIHKATR